MATRKKSGLWIEETAAIMRVSLPEAQRYVYDQAYDDVDLGLCIARQEQERGLERTRSDSGDQD